jgi:hypothetical protein
MKKREKKKKKRVEWEDAIKTGIERCYIWSLLRDPNACLSIYVCKLKNEHLSEMYCIVIV